MAFDENDLERITRHIELSKDELIKIISDQGKGNWESYLSHNEELPQCYGLIALQILCASNMEFGKYNEILEDKLNLRPHTLQIYFKSYQDSLWGVARKHIESLGFKCNFPKPSTGPGCFIQYPKSQAYLNQKDLENLSRLFTINKLKPHIDISLSDFVEILSIDFLLDIPKEFITPHSRKVGSQYGFKQDVFQKQLYNFYLNWDGENKHYKVNQQKKSLCKLFFDGSRSFFTINTSQEYIIKFESGFIQSLLKFNVIDNPNGIILLRRDPSWGDFEEIKKVSLGDEVIVLIFGSYLLKYNSLLKTDQPILTIPYENTLVLRFNIDVHHLDVFEEYISTKRFSIEWLGGIKLDRSTYLNGSGPQFRALENCTLLINGSFEKRLKGEIFNFQNLENGDYVIRPTNARRISFSVSDSTYNDYSNNQIYGWDLKSLKPSNSKWDISGLRINSTNHKVTIKNFIDLQGGRIKKIDCNNQVLNLLSKQKT